MSGLRMLLFVVFVLFSIGLHELGHLATAKMFGIKVQQYFIGFGPKIWSTMRGETEYGVKALPLGGFVRIAGMNPFEEVPPEDRDRVFKAKKPWKRSIVLAAGSFTHFVLAIAIIAGVLMVSGRPDPDRPTTVVADVTQRLQSGGPSPAAAVGLEPGDRIVAVDGVEVERWEEAVSVIRARPDQQVVLVIERDGRRMDVPVRLASVPDPQAPGTEERRGFLGVGPRFEVERMGPIAATREGALTVWEGTILSLSALRDVFAPSTLARLFRVAAGSEPRRIEDPATIVGVTRAAGGMESFARLLFLVASFNVFVGIANLMPLPPLDGGHLAVLAYEKVTRRDVDMRKLLPLTATVLSVLGMLFFLLLYLDIFRPLPRI